MFYQTLKMQLHNCLRRLPQHLNTNIIWCVYFLELSGNVLKWV